MYNMHVNINLNDSGINTKVDPMSLNTKKLEGKRRLKDLVREKRETNLHPMSPLKTKLKLENVNQHRKNLF